MTTRKLERKWVILLENRIGPCEELVTLIPRWFVDDDDWYFIRSELKAVPASRVFDTPQAAALAVIEHNRKQMRLIEAENERLQEWYDKLLEAATVTTTDDKGV